jgi:hypothetical protein
MLGNNTVFMTNQEDNLNENSKIQNTTFQDENNQIEKIDESVKDLPQTKKHYPKTTEQIVREYFLATPVLIDVARCESNFIQFDKDGNILRGKVNPQDVGVMQINEKYHLAESQRLGFNIYTTEGNLAYAEYLYETQGTRPWNYSSKCWGKTREVAISQ